MNRSEFSTCDHCSPSGWSKRAEESWSSSHQSVLRTWIVELRNGSATEMNQIPKFAPTAPCGIRVNQRKDTSVQKIATILDDPARAHPDHLVSSHSNNYSLLLIDDISPLHHARRPAPRFPSSADDFRVATRKIASSSLPRHAPLPNAKRAFRTPDDMACAAVPTRSRRAPWLAIYLRRCRTSHR